MNRLKCTVIRIKNNQRKIIDSKEQNEAPVDNSKEKEMYELKMKN